MTKSCPNWSLALVLVLPLLLPTLTHSFELNPLPTKSERKVALQKYGIKFRLEYVAIESAIHAFSSPVHEAITQFAHGCQSNLEECKNVEDVYVEQGTIAGVRWNDDPPFAFEAGQGRYSHCPKDSGQTISFALNTRCWVAHFRDASTRASREEATYLNGKGSLLARSHFGDLQFLHSMAQRTKESPHETKRSILVWAEFVWRQQNSGSSDYFSPKTRLGEISVPFFSDFFSTKEQRDIESLFTIGRPWLRHQIRNIAFGSLLHLVQDSFSTSHVSRSLSARPSCGVPPITRFHTYASQNKDAHKARDQLGQAETKTSMIGALKRLLEYRDVGAAWLVVREYLDTCLFAFDDSIADSDSEVGE